MLFSLILQEKREVFHMHELGVGGAYSIASVGTHTTIEPITGVKEMQSAEYMKPP